jgi:hypothetical protein
MLYQSKQPVKRKPLLFVSLGVGIILIVISVLELTNTTHLLHKNKTATSPATAPISTEKNRFDPSAKPTPSPSSEKDNQSSSAALIQPSGAFVSNHKPNLGGSPAPSSEQSVCNTTPGAKCSITFTKDSITKTLESKVADSSGSVYWSWDVKSLGLSAGSWEIAATSSLNSQTLTSKDSLALEVRP